jgi:hypothetical protein
MNKPSFLEGVVVALVASVAGSVWLWMFAMVAPWMLAFKSAIGALAFGYVFYLLSRSTERRGRTTAVTAWFLAVVVLWLLPIAPLSYVFAHAGLLWLLRAWYFHTRLLAVLADLLLTLSGFAAALWAAYWTDSVLLGFWCFFLVQALFIWIPGVGAPSGAPSTRVDSDAENFARAQRAADAALRKLSMNSSI